jgi:DNA-binding SARP family transcriptional activator
VLLRLRTFGGLTLRVGDTTITGIATQRKPLALLSLLAVAGDDGMSREKLLAFLWPEKEERQARHILNQILYAQRRYAEDEGLFLGRKTVRLNHEKIETDVARFRESLSRGDFERTVATYRGPFLDGFFLDQAPEFEIWVEEQRASFARSCVGALDRLAVAATGSGDHAGAAAWRRRAAELDPLDARAATLLAEALVRAGDRPAAIRALRLHQDRVRQDLEVEPDPTVQRMADALAGGGT